MQNVGDLGGGGVVCGQGSGEASQILTKKSSTRKNMNEEAGNYYSEMLKNQKEVALKRMKLLTEKIRNEVIKSFVDIKYNSYG